MIHLGVDPGASGAIALLDDERADFLVMPRAGKDIDWSAIARWLTDHVHGQAVAYVERVGAMPGQGVTSMFSFGGAYHGVRAVLATLEVPVELVSPNAWKKSVLVGTKRDKAAAIAYAARRWPHLDLRRTARCKGPHEGACEALCIAEYGRRQASPGRATA